MIVKYLESGDQTILLQYISLSTYLLQSKLTIGRMIESIFHNAIIFWLDLTKAQNFPDES